MGWKLNPDLERACLDLAETQQPKPVRVEPANEAEFTDQVIQYAQARGWRVAHFRPGRTKSGGWRTAVSGDGKGFPDCLLIRGCKMIAAELKMPGNKTTEEQRQWLFAFAGAGVEAKVWYPSDFAEIEELLSEGTT